MPTVRKTTYKDYGLSQQDIEFLLAYCRSMNPDKELIRHCAEEECSGYAEQLFKSVVQKRSYERLGYVPIGKVDFYAHRRRMLSRLKYELMKDGTMLVIDGKIWSWGLLK